MYKIAESKCDLFNQSDRNVCQACLSADRKLSSIGEFVDIFINICNNSHNVKPQACLCWECMALLKKIKLFKTQVEDVQKILRSQFVNEQKPILLTSLSKLSKSTTENVIITITHNGDNDDDAKEDLNIKQDHEREELNIKQIHEEQELNIKHIHNQEELNIKQENDDSNDDFNFDQNNDFSLNEENKEKVSRKKNYSSTKKMSQYRIISDSTKKVGRKKFSIKNDDPNIWLERERNTDFYKNLRFKCDLCVRGFSNEKKLNKHLLRHDKSSGRHTCPTCSMRYSTETALHSHKRSHRCGWQCNRCDFRCYSGQRMSAHINTHSVVQCAHCDAKFQDVTTFYLHYKALHTIFLCDYCGKRCKTKYSIEKHIKIHHMDSHTCATCQRHYKSLCALRKHIAATHATVRAYCVACDKHYRSQALYRRHVLTSRAHGHERDEQTTKAYSCPECTNTYSRRAFMMNHYRHVHTNQSKHHCEHCDKRFLNRTKYVDHMRYYHEGVKREKNKLCTVCGKGFAATRTLINHMRTHTGERPYECSYCPAKFTQRTSMVSHVRFIHMKDKRPAH